MLNIQIPCRRHDLVGCRGADNRHRVALGLVSRNKFAGFRINQPGNFLSKQPLAVAGIVSLTATCQVLRVHRHEGGETHITQTKTSQRPGELIQFIGL